MAAPILTISTSVFQNNKLSAAYLKTFLDGYKSIDFDIYERLSKKVILPSGMYGDSGVSGASNLYQGSLNNFVVKGWDDLGYWMNWGSTQDGINDADYNTADNIDYNYQNFEIEENGAYTGGNYDVHQKALTTKYEISMPIVRFGATQKYDSVTKLLAADEDIRQIVKEFGKMGAAAMAQYVRATLINEAVTTATTLNVLSTGLLDATSKSTLSSALKTIKNKLKKVQAEPFGAEIYGSDKVGTTPIRKRYVAIINSQIEDYISQLDGFVHVTQYPAQSFIPGEFGCIPALEIAFVTNDVIIRQSGVAGTGALTRADVFGANGFTTYNMLVMGKDAYCTATVSGAEKYKMYIDEPGKGADVLRVDNRMGWKSLFGAKVLRSGFIYNLDIDFTYA